MFPVATATASASATVSVTASFVTKHVRRRALSLSASWNCGKPALAFPKHKYDGHHKCSRTHTLHNNNHQQRQEQQQSPPLAAFVAAPMVAASDFAFRSLCRQYGVHVAFTQMLHARNINRGAVFRQNHADFYECYDHHDDDDDDNNNNGKDDTKTLLLPPLTTLAQENFLQGLQRPRQLPQHLQPFTKGPLIVQLAGDDVDQVLQAAQWIVEHTHGRVDGIDLNCGCPQQIAKKGNYGAFLMEQDDGQQVARILTSLRQALPSDISVSTKIRLPLDNLETRWYSRLQRLQATGIDFITIHGRTLKENKSMSGPSNLQAIAQAVEWLDVPVIANGGIQDYSDVRRVAQATGAAAFMSSEGLLERPDLFLDNGDIDAASSPRITLERQFRIARDYLTWTTAYPPLPGTLGQQGGSFNVVRGHLFKFLYRYWQEETDLRDGLARHDRILGLCDARDLVNQLYSRYQNLSDEALSERASSNPKASWYQRHWQANGVTSTGSFPQRQRQATTSPTCLTVQERKLLMQKRIAKLQKQRQEKEQTKTCTSTNSRLQSRVA